MEIYFTTGLKRTDEQNSCVNCTYFVSCQDEYQTHLDPWEFGSCHHPEIVENSQRFGLYMRCSLHKSRRSPDSDSD